jgi:hypothetical protein
MKKMTKHSANPGSLHWTPKCQGKWNGNKMLAEQKLMERKH